MLRWMTFTTALAMLISLTAGWAYLCPEQADQLITHLKDQHRQRLIRRAGESYARQLETRLHGYAKQKGIEPGIVSEVMENRREEVIRRMGECYVEELLGPEEESWPLD
jgi:hypothetical protein